MRLGREWKETLIEGPAGTGKSRGVAQYIDTLCNLFPGIRVLACRQTLKSLRESVQATLENKVWGEKHPILTATSATRAHRDGYTYPYATSVVGGVTYSGRSEIILGGLDKPGRTFSTEYDIVWVEEAFEVSLDAWESLLRTNRNGEMPWQQMIASTNPDSLYHWLNQRPEEKDEATDKPLMRRLKSKHWENPFLWDLQKRRWRDMGSEYVGGALGHLSGPRRARLLRGEWVSADGLIFDSFDLDLHYIERSELPEIKWAFGAMDWGYRNPGALTVWGVDADRRVYCIFEAYHTQKPLDWWAEMCTEANKRCQEEFECEMRVVIADSAEPRSIETLNGLLRKPNYEGRGYVRATERKNRLAQMMLVDRAMRPEIELNNGKPAWYIAHDTLLHSPDPDRIAKRKPHNLRMEVLTYTWRKAEDGQVVKDEEDPLCDAHAIDSAMYGCDFLWQRDLTPPKRKPALPPESFGGLMGHDGITFTD